MQHIVVIYLENWSFDSLYGLFPGADGLAQATSAPPQVGLDGQPYSTLPQVLATAPGTEGTNPFVAENSAVAKPAPPRPVDTRFPADLPNQPFSLAQYAPATAKVADPGASFYQEQAEIDGGKMDRFVLDGKSGALPLGWYDATQFPLGRLAAQYTLLDHFFHAAYGGSLLNHFFLIGAAAPKWPNAPAVVRAKLAPDGKVLQNGAVTPDGYLVNTAYSSIGPHPANTPKDELVPPLTNVTIGDRLSAKGISWAWYSGGWDAAIAGHPGPLFEFNHQPFAVLRQLRPRDTGFQALTRRDGFRRRRGRWHPAGGELREALRRRQRAPRLHRPVRGRRPDGRSGGKGHAQLGVEEHGDHRHLRRERRLLGPCSPAQTRPLRGRHPGARHRDLPVRPAPLRRPYGLRHHVNSRLHRAPFRAATVDQP